MPTGLGHDDMEDKLVPTRVDPHHMQGAGEPHHRPAPCMWCSRCHSLPPQHALAFAMGTHSRLGSDQAAASATAVGADRGTRHALVRMLDDNLVTLRWWWTCATDGRRGRWGSWRVWCGLGGGRMSMEIPTLSV